jgi:signal peptide peptidase SppA
VPVAIRKRDIPKIEAFVLESPWAIEEGTLNSIVEVLQLRRNGMEFTAEEVAARIEAKRGGSGARDTEDEGYQVLDGVAVLPLHGVLAPKLNLFQAISGGTSTQEFAGWYMQALNDPKVKAIVLDVDSPGGDAKGNEEVARMLRDSRGAKPVVAVATGMMASAAYYIGSAASEVVASDSAEVGSIGTYLIHKETSKADQAAGVTYSVVKAGANKAVGNGVEPLTSESRAVLQERVSDLNDQFVAAVAANRGVTPETVSQNFGQGKVMLAPRAKAAGLVDRIGTLQQVVSELQTKYGRAKGTNARQEEESQVAPKTETNAASEADPIQTPHAAVAPTGAAAPPAADPAPSAAELAAARTAERARIQDLQARGALLQISAADVDAAISAGTTVPEALVQWTDARAKSHTPVDNTTSRVEGGTAEGDKYFQGARDALLLRFNGLAEGEKPSQFARDMQYFGMLDFAKMSLQLSGHRLSSMDPDDIARAALKGDGGDITIRASDYSTARPSDFPNLMSALMGKMLDVAAQYSPATYKDWAYKIPSVPDFKPKTIIAVGEFGEFAQVRDGDDFLAGNTPSEEASWIAVDKYGDEWNLTPKMIVDDDLGEFDVIARDKVIAHDMTLNRLCINLLTGNATAGDGNALFDDTNHGNDRSSGGAPSQSELAAMRLKLRKQKGVSAKRKLNLTLETILIPEDLETATEQMLKVGVAVVPVTTATGEIFRGRVKYVVDPQLADSSTAVYYGFANKNLARAIVYTFQKGFEQMKTRNYYSPKSNSRTFQFEGRFAAAVRNWRGVVRNNGA